MFFDKKSMLICECYSEGDKDEGISSTVITHEGIEIVKTVVTGGGAESKREAGTYLTICQGELYRGGEFLRDKLSRAVAFSLSQLIKEETPQPRNFLFVGLGNRDLSSDRIGVEICNCLSPIRSKNEKLASLSLISPGILSSGGIEAFDHVKGLLSVCGFDAVIVADSLSSYHPERLLTTVQISNTGITPASGTRNFDACAPKMREISKKTLGVPVISLGVPTVTLFDGKLYTPYTIDGEIEPICQIISDGITLALTESREILAKRK